MVDLGSLLKRVLRYGLVGILNGVVSLSLIGVLDIGLHIRPEIANTAGYAAGVTLSFALARSFVFQNTDGIRTTGPRYILVIIIGFLLNQLVLHGMLSLLGSGAMQHVVAQLGGITTYTVFTFMACNLWVFPSPEAVNHAARLDVAETVGGAAESD